MRMGDCWDLWELKEGLISKINICDTIIARKGMPFYLFIQSIIHLWVLEWGGGTRE